MRGRTGLYKAGLGGWAASVYFGSDWVTSLRISPQTCTELLTTAFAVPAAVRRTGSIPVCSYHSHADEVLAVPTMFFSSPGSNVDCASRGLALLSFSVVEYHVVRQVACGRPGGCLPHSFHPAIGTFLGLALDLGSDTLYDLAKDIPDVMGLRALRPSAAIVKVMSVPDSQCVRVVTPDDHVNIGFYEVLIHDLEDEDLPFVTLSELGCLRLDWTFMSRYGSV